MTKALLEILTSNQIGSRDARLGLVQEHDTGAPGVVCPRRPDFSKSRRKRMNFLHSIVNYSFTVVTAMIAAVWGMTSGWNTSLLSEIWVIGDRLPLQNSLYLV